MLQLESADPIIDLLQANRAGVPHRAATVSRETVAVDVNDVDIDGPLSDPFFKDAGTFVDQGVKRALEDLLGWDRASWNP